MIPAPTYWQVQTHKGGPALLLPHASCLAGSTIALAEWLSLAWWGIRGEL